MTIETIKNKTSCCSTVQNHKRLDIEIQTKQAKEMAWCLKIQEHSTKINLYISTGKSKIIGTAKSCVTDLEMGKSVKKDEILKI